MEITYIGHSCFKLKGKDITVVIDPYDPKIGLKEPKLKCDILLLSHDHFDHSYTKSVSEYHLLVDGPGEYETNGVLIHGLKTFHDDKLGEERGTNTIFLIEISEISVLHLGDLGHELSKETLEKIAQVDVLLIPVGGIYTIDAKTATRVISSLEPGIVIPMHYQTDELELGDKLDGLDKFLNEMGVENPKKLDKYNVSRKMDIPEETEVIVLQHQN